MDNIAIEIINISKQFQPEKIFALKNISASIKRKSMTGLVGPDGAGKTTLIRLMTGLMTPTGGQIKVEGLDTLKNKNEIQANLSYMPQKFGLYEDLTVMENLNLYAQLRGVKKEDKSAIFKKMLEFTDLNSFISRRAAKLSGGMKQKLGLACALLSQPQILLLDEPTNGVDPISRRELWKMVQELVKNGMTVVWSTAYLDEAEICEEVLLLNEGNLLFDGLPKNLTMRVKGRVFYFTPTLGNKRQALEAQLIKPEVIDGSIQGDHVRVLFKKDFEPDPKKFISTVPCFEDAFIDLLGGKFSRISILAQSFSHKKKLDKLPIEAKNLTKTFGDFIAANHISFSVNQGEIFGLLGPNGAGKSTTFKMLCGLLTPTEGKALVTGIDLEKGSDARSRIGYMAQKFSLYSDLTVKQNLNFFSGVYGLNKKKSKIKIDEMVEIFHLTKYLSTATSLLPLGFKQRLALSCALMHEPDVLFLDEPTSGVDPLIRREFWTHINGMVQKGVTILITTHFMDEAEYCDRIALVNKGIIIAIDTPDNLKKLVQSDMLPNPTLEDTFIALIQREESTR